MSVSQLLEPTIAKKWSNLYVNSIVVAEDIESEQSTIIGRNTSAQVVSTGVNLNATFNSITSVGDAITYNSGVFTAERSGKYLVAYSIDFPAYTAGGPVGVHINVTSSSASQGLRAISRLGSSQTYGFFVSSSDVLLLNEGDVFSIVLAQNSGGNLNCNAAGTLSIYQLP